MPDEPLPRRDPKLDLIASVAAPEPLQQQEVAAEANRREREELELDQLREIVRQLHQNIEERRRYAGRLFGVMVGWLVVVAYVVLAQGFGVGLHAYGRFHLADSVV